MKYSSLLIFLLSVNTHINAQEITEEFDDFYKDISNDFDSVSRENKNAFEAFADSINNEYIKFIEESELEFMDLLKENFSDYKVIKGSAILENPKPFKIPLNNALNHGLTKIALKESNQPNREEKNQFLFLPSVIINKDSEKRPIKIGFLGHDFLILLDTSIIQLKDNNLVSSENVAGFYGSMRNKSVDETIKQLLSVKSKLNLNDWGYFLLVDELVKSIYPDNNSQKLLSWYLLLKTGYKVKIAFAENSLYLLFASKQKVYEMPYLMVNGDVYYAWNCDLNNLKTYELEYYNSKKYFDLYQNQPLLFSDESVEKILKFQHHQNSYNIKLNYDRRYIDYFARYPKLGLSYYFTTPVSSVFKESVNSALRPLIDGRNQSESINFLLTLVQSSFQYMTDIEQFGNEKYMLPEELLYYGYSDCDDRTSFFIYLVNELLHLNIVALEFEGHVCSAVEITDQSDSGSVIFNNKKYIICDPTYVGSPAGFVMPPFNNADAGIIDFNKYLNDFQLSSLIWDKINAGGGFESDNENNIICDTNENIYATGIFNNSIKIGEQNCRELDSNFHTFLTSLNSNYEAEWIKSFSGTGNNFSYGLTSSAKNNLYLYGFFEDTLLIDSNQLIAEKQGDYFVAKFNDLGNILWIKKIPIAKSISESEGFAAILDSSGNLLYINALDRNYIDGYQISIDKDETCHLAGIVSNGVFRADTNKNYSVSNVFDLISFLVNENDRLINQNYPKTISLFYSIINFIKKAGGEYLNGTILQNTLTSVNSKFPAESPEVYNNVGKINKINNANGLLSLKTIDQQPLFFAPLKAEDNAMVKLGYQYDNAKLEVLNGITIGNNNQWFKVRSILFEKTSGEIIFNYDNHYQKKLPVQSEILR